MKRNIIQIVALALITATAGLNTLAQDSPGKVDFSRVAAPGQNAGIVDINVGPELIQLASRFVEKQEPEAAKLLQSVKLVRVNVLSFSDENRDDLQKRMEALRKELDGKGWQRIVTVQEKNGENVGVQLKMRGSEAVEGVFVSVLDGKKEAVLLNIVGDIKPEQISAVGQALNIDAIKQAGKAIKK